MMRVVHVPRLLAELCGGPAGQPTHARQSVRESLRVFKRVTERLGTQPASANDRRRRPGATTDDDSSSFERLCSATGVEGTGRLSEVASCGDTQLAFASLFLPPAGWECRRLLDGSVLAQLASHANIVMYSWRVHVSTRAREALGYPALSSAARRDFSRWAQRIGQWSSARSMDQLERSLLQLDEPHHLPRVFFCSLAWVTPGRGDSLAPLSLQDRKRKMPELNGGGAVGVQNGLLLDHRFAIVKHDNHAFELVQGYMAHSPDDGGAADAELVATRTGAPLPPGRFSTAGFTPGAGSAGFGLIGWQRSTGGAFGRSRMATSLLASLRGFASNKTFDASAYEEAFGVRHAGGQRYWPAVRSTELTDDFILGHGQRHVADALEKRLDELEEDG